MNKPMMSEKEIEIIDRLLESLKPKKCLEWGSGGSTVYFPNKHESIEYWRSIEHNGKFHKYIKNAVHKKVELKLVRLEEYLSSANGKYDFILIDGLMRKECLMYAQALLNRGGVILMHDSARAEYQKAIKEWEGKAEKLSEGEGVAHTYAHRGLHKFTL